MKPSLQPVFQRLRAVLETHRAGCSVSRDTPTHFELNAPVGAATIKAWGGKTKSPTMPVAWVEIKKNYVSYHLMGIYMNAHLDETLSESLQARKQGKSCFNFTQVDERLFQELAKVTVASLRALKKGGFITDVTAG